MKIHEDDARLRSACVELERRVLSVQESGITERVEIRRAEQHVRLAIQYLELVLPDGEHTPMIGLEVATAAVERIAERQIQHALDPEQWSNPLPPSESQDRADVPHAGASLADAAEDQAQQRLARQRLARPAQQQDANEGDQELPVPEFGDAVEPSNRQPLEGDNSTISISDLVSWFSLQSRDGVLRVSIPNESVTIEFEQGTLVHASSDRSPAGCRLGEILVQQGALGQAELDDFLSSWVTGGTKRFGSILEEGQLISETALRQALQTQVRWLLRRAFEADKARFALREGRLCENGGRLRMNVAGLLLENARLLDEAGS